MIVRARRGPRCYSIGVKTGLPPNSIGIQSLTVPGTKDAPAQVQAKKLQNPNVDRKALDLSLRSQGQTRGPGSGHGIQMANLRSNPQTADQLANERLERLMALLDGSLSTSEVAQKMEAEPTTTEAEAAFLWSPKGAQVRQDLATGLAALAERHPLAAPRGRIMHTETHLPTAQQDKIIESRTSPLPFMSAMNAVHEAAFAKDPNLGSIAQGVLNKFEGQNYGLMPYLKSLAEHA